MNVGSIFISMEKIEYLRWQKKKMRYIYNNQTMLKLKKKLEGTEC